MELVVRFDSLKLDLMILSGLKDKSGGTSSLFDKSQETTETNNFTKLLSHIPCNPELTRNFPGGVVHENSDV